MLTPQAPGTRRPLRDLGAFALLTVTPLFARFTGDGDDEEVAADLRELALLWPDDAEDYAYASTYRLYAWGVWMHVMIVVFAAASLARAPLGPAVTPLLEWTMTGAVSIGMFATGMMLLSAARQLWCRLLEGEINTRIMWTKDRPVPPESPGLLVRSCLPTNLDVLPALWLAYAFVPLLRPA